MTWERERKVNCQFKAFGKMLTRVNCPQLIYSFCRGKSDHGFWQEVCLKIGETFNNINIDTNHN